MSESFKQAGYHKQITNRLTEPFQMINVVVTSTEWENFFDLRCHRDAMPEFQALAKEIQQKLLEAKPQELAPGEWHLPYLLPEEARLACGEKLALSTARCASVSYRTVEGSLMTAERAKEVFGKLMGSKPWHASPTEHQARFDSQCGMQGLRGNFRYPWAQHRKFIEAGMVPV